MSVADRLPTMDDKDLQVLKANALRLQTTGAPAQQRAAADLLPLIEAELTGRPAKVVKAKPAVTKKPATAKKAKAEAAE